jgi:hypothetical protein
MDLRQLSWSSRIDAVYLPLPYAERWGARPITLQAQVLSTVENAEVLEGGRLPPYVVAGPALPAATERNSARELRLIIQTTLNAVKTFNDAHTPGISTVGFAYEFLQGTYFGKSDPTILGRGIAEAYDEICAPSETP